MNARSAEIDALVRLDRALNLERTTAAILPDLRHELRPVSRCVSQWVNAMRLR